METLQDRVAVITGASAGIGAAVARGLAGAGMRVMLGARRGAQLSALCDSIRADGGTADFAVTDMRDEAQVDRLIATAVDRFGQIDALINNAAIGTVRTIVDGRTEEWRAIIETNLLGTLVACRGALRYMLPRRCGNILNMTSASAHEAWPYLAVYAASKAAIHTFSDGLRAEIAGQGIRVMTIEIHNVAGTDFAAHFDRSVLPDAIKRWEQLGLLSRESPMIAPEDVARAVLFQLSQPDPVSVHHVTIRSRAN